MAKDKDTKDNKPQPWTAGPPTPFKFRAGVSSAGEAFEAPSPSARKKAKGKKAAKEVSSSEASESDDGEKRAKGKKTVKSKDKVQESSTDEEAESDNNDDESDDKGKGKKKKEEGKKGKSKKRARDSSGNEKRKKPSKAQKKQKKGEANVTDETAGLDIYEKYENRLPDLEEARQDRMATLIAKNQFRPTLGEFGVRIVDIKMSEPSGAKIAGYLNCVCASQLGELWQKCYDIIDALHKAEQVSTLSSRLSHSYQINLNYQLVVRPLLFEGKKKGK